MLRTLYVLVFLEIHSRRILYFDCTAHLNGIWVTQQARNLAWELNQLESPIKLAIHDRDAKFVHEFDCVLQSEGIEVVLTPYRQPRANRQRPHLALDLRPPEPAPGHGSGQIFRQQRLNGLISEYYRAA